MTHVASDRAERGERPNPSALVDESATTTLVAGVGGVPAEVDNDELLAWVAEVAEMTQPARIHWCDGSEEEWTEVGS